MLSTYWSSIIIIAPVLILFFLSFFDSGNVFAINTLQTDQLIKSKDNYLTYQNDTYSFKIDYPSTWIVAENNPNLILRVKDGVVNFFSPPEDHSDTTSENLNIVVSKLDENEPMSLDGLPEKLTPYFKEIFRINGPLTSQDISLDGNPAKKIAFSYELFGRTVENTQIYSMKLGNVYVINYICESSVCPTYFPIFEKMIHSFRFTSWT